MTTNPCPLVVRTGNRVAVGALSALSETAYWLLLLSGVVFSVSALVVFYQWYKCFDKRSDSDRQKGIDLEDKIFEALGDKTRHSSKQQLTWTGLEEPSSLQFNFTVLLAVLFCAAILLKALGAGNSSPAPTGIQVDGGSFEIDGQATLRLGDPPK